MSAHFLVAILKVHSLWSINDGFLQVFFLDKIGQMGGISRNERNLCRSGNTAVFFILEWCWEEQKPCLNGKSCLNQTWFSLLFHFGKSEMLLKSNVLTLKNYCTELLR